MLEKFISFFFNFLGFLLWELINRNLEKNLVGKSDIVSFQSGEE
jgi:hypothetical protein